MEAEASSSTASSATTAQVPSSVSGNTEDEETNPPVCTIEFTGPIHQVIQPAYDIIRGQEAENEASSSRAISHVNGTNIEKMQVVFTLKNPTQVRAAANSGPPPQNYDHIIEIPEDEIETLKRKRKLYHAARTGDWKTVERILRLPLFQLPILSTTGETALHIAAGANQVGFVKKILDKIGNNISLDAVDKRQNTALSTAAAAGSYKIVKKLIKNNVDQLLIRNDVQVTPAHIAAMFGHGAIASELYNRCIFLEHDPHYQQLETRQPGLTDEEKISLFFTCINNEIFDLAFKLLNGYPNLKLDCRRDFNSETALHLLARNPSVFSSQRQGIWNQIFPGCCFFTSSCNSPSVQTQASKFLKELLDKLSKREEDVFQNVIRNPNNVLFEAAASGNYNLLANLIRSFPELIWEKDAEGKLIFHTAILKRDMKIFKLVYETGLVRVVLKSWADPRTEENILHFAAKLPIDDTLASIAGEAFQLEKEVSLFKELEGFVPASYRYKRNTAGKTPRELFTLEHQDMLKEAEKWMKKNASYGLIVATLIVTVVFPAAFTLPHGNKTNHLNRALTALAITNAIAMGLSTLSMILFVYILISRYAEVNFISSLPKSFLFGLILLGLSLLFLLISFGLVTYVDLKTI